MAPCEATIMPSNSSTGKDLPGMSTQTFFDFGEALDYIKSRLDERLFTSDWKAWAISVVDTLRACHPPDIEKNHKVSVLWFAFKFLNNLWLVWFGRSSVPPWYSMAEPMACRGQNCINDVQFDLYSLSYSVKNKQDDGERLIRRALGAHFPLIVRRTRGPV